eukprot:603629-Rhodomonas_salina.1
MHYAMSGTDSASAATRCVYAATHYAVSGTDVGYAATHYAMSDTDLAMLLLAQPPADRSQ